MSILVSQVHAGKLQHTKAKTGLSSLTHLVSLPFAGPYYIRLTWTWTVAAQNFEYKISCILDKPMESMFGYISVLVCRLFGHNWCFILMHVPISLVLSLRTGKCCSKLLLNNV